MVLVPEPQEGSYVLLARAKVHGFPETTFQWGDVDNKADKHTGASIVVLALSK